MKLCNCGCGQRIGAVTVSTRKGHFEVRAFTLDAHDWNARARYVHESKHRTLAVAMREAARVATDCGFELLA